MSDLTELHDQDHPCYQHPCDMCDLCMSGVCCGADLYEANLPLEGTWKGRTFVPVGQMHLNAEGKLICHICGAAHHGLWRHLRTHKVTAEEYRAYFGLKVSEPLASPKLQDVRSEKNGGVMDPAALERLDQFRRDFTAEQRSLWSKNRVQRAGATGVGTRDGRQKDRAAAWHQQRQGDPAKDAAWKGAIRVRRRKKDAEGFAPVITCIVCGAQFSMLNTHKRAGVRKTCGSVECKREVKRRAQAASAASRKKQAD